jgi:ribose 5-phosphate isomerase A
MAADLSPQDRAKKAAALRAAQFVQPGMKVGLGTGSTAVFLVRELGRRLREEGLQISAVPTSIQTAELAREEGIEVSTLDALGKLDLTIDGTDEFDADFNLIKGGGGALLREKVVATASERMIVIADESKQVEALGAFPLPVEVLAFGLATTKTLLEETLYGLDVLGREVVLRETADGPFVTDEGNHILDLHLKRIAQPRQVALILNQVPGVVENGLFIDICDTVIIGRADGSTDLRDAPANASGRATGAAAELNLFSPAES